MSFGRPLCGHGDLEAMWAVLSQPFGADMSGVFQLRHPVPTQRNCWQLATEEPSVSGGTQEKDIGKQMLDDPERVSADALTSGWCAASC